MRKFMPLCGLLWALVAPAAFAAQTAVFDTATLGLKLPSVAIDKTIFQDLDLVLKLEDISLVSVGDALPLAQADAFPSYIPSYDVATQNLTMPRLQIGDTVFSKIVVKLNNVSVKSVGATTSAAELVAALPSRKTQNVCAVPRGADVLDPATNKPYPDVQGTLQDELSWIGKFINDTYLWYKDVPTVFPTNYVVGGSVDYFNPATNSRSSKTLATNFDVVDAYFNSQRTRAVTETGAPVDQFHYTRSTVENNALFNSASSYGFGVHWSLVASAPPRKIVVVYVDPNTPASDNAIKRGTTVVSINGYDFATTNNVSLLNEALFSPIEGKSYTFELQEVGATKTRTITMAAKTIKEATVPTVGTLAAPNNKVGYLLFTGYLGPAEFELANAVYKLKAANNGTGISDLILDLRYNGGGYLTIASQLSYMIAGAARTEGKVFSQLVYNDKNPFAATTASAYSGFTPTTVGFSAAPGQSLPQLGLQRVYVLTTRGTASASEETINALRGVGVEVIQIGTTTRGKPYGFTARDNCGVSYFAVQFKGLNNAGFGDYSDGFIPGGKGTTAANLPGCVVADDFDHQLGDSAEALVSAALRYKSTGSCSVGRIAQSAAEAAAIEAAQGTLLRDPIREIMLLDDRH